MNLYISKTQTDNKGFSLIELLVAFAIFGVISVVIVGMMASGMRFFRDTSSNVGLQYEYQVVMTQLREYVVDCNAGIAFDETENALYIVERTQIPQDDDDYVEGATNNYRYRTHVFVFDGVSGDVNNPGSLNYLIEPITVSADYNPPAHDTVWANDVSVVSTRMTDFNINITLEVLLGAPNPSGVNRARANVEAEMGFVNLTRSYVATQNIATRNRVVTADSYDALIANIAAFDASVPPS